GSCSRRPRPPPRRSAWPSTRGRPDNPDFPAAATRKPRAMLRFCMVTTFYPPYSFGGDAIFVEALSRGLAEQGHEVDVIHCLDSYRALARATPREAAAGGLAQAAPAAPPAGVRCP